jgi:hypothetical protein
MVACWQDGSKTSLSVSCESPMRHVHYASWEDSRYSKGERTMKVKVKSCC